MGVDWKAMLKVDAHHHLLDPRRRQYPWLSARRDDLLLTPFTAAQFEALADRHRIDASVLVQTLTDAGETVEFLSTAATSPVVAAVVGWVDLTSGRVAEDLDVLQSGPGGSYLRGIRHPLPREADLDWLGRDDVRSGLRELTRRGLAFDVLADERHLPAATAVAQAHPDLSMVINHAAKPPLRGGDLTRWREAIIDLAVTDNVTCKVSGLVTEADHAWWTINDLRPAVELVLEVFGPGRVMLGSDWPVCLVAGSYGQVLDTYRGLLDGLSVAERRDVEGGVAASAYGLA
ncbi:amidohydrolase family protein [Ruania alkalisoli]|uniref:Amidohydrolase family protein n=1 Tax=Ruania alkalisoli TaxID=2779775 RepID=A0A7M1SSK5_9MICO|nr:amidohydrolase family protein [Ruania alkalisoli]QOR70475.1 amidohydrolase family protein [Ruania alkalisoli]